MAATAAGRPCAGGTPNLISNADLANPNCAPTYHPQFMRRPCYESPCRGGRVFGSPYIHPRRFDINFHTYYAIVACVTHGHAARIRSHNREWNLLSTLREAPSLSTSLFPSLFLLLSRRIINATTLLAGEWT